MVLRTMVNHTRQLFEVGLYPVFIGEVYRRVVCGTFGQALWVTVLRVGMREILNVTVVPFGKSHIVGRIQACTAPNSI